MVKHTKEPVAKFMLSMHCVKAGATVCIFVMYMNSFSRWTCKHNSIKELLSELQKHTKNVLFCFVLCMTEVIAQFSAMKVKVPEL